MKMTVPIVAALLLTIAACQKGGGGGGGVASAPGGPGNQNNSNAYGNTQDLAQRIRDLFRQLNTTYAGLADYENNRAHFENFYYLEERVVLLITQTDAGQALLNENLQRMRTIFARIQAQNWDVFSPANINQYQLTDYVTQRKLEDAAIVHTIAQTLDFLKEPLDKFGPRGFTLSQDPIQTWIQLVRVRLPRAFDFFNPLLRPDRLVRDLRMRPRAITAFVAIGRDQLDIIQRKAREKSKTRRDEPSRRQIRGDYQPQM